MRLIGTMLALALAFGAGAATAQTGDVVVRGQREKPSNWREAETQHVIVLSDGGEREVTEIAHNLERLYFLLSILTNRADRPDDTVKLRVTLIGDLAEFQSMDLHNLRWQQGPYNEIFDVRRYYDPRADGAVLATTRIDQKVVLQRGKSLADIMMGMQVGTAQPGPGTPQPGAPAGLFGLQSSADLVPGVNEEAVPMSAQGMIYAGFAQHFLTTMFPAAYPRWYLDGFGQLFSTLVVRGDTTMEYGRPPVGASAVLRKFGSVRMADVVSGAYLDWPTAKTRWTPVHAWMLTHFLFFSPERRGQLRNYLQALAKGASSEEATAAFGDLDVLAKDLRAYFFARKPFERMTYPAGRAHPPIVRRLTQGEAAFVKGRLELASRVETAAAGPARDARAAWMRQLQRTAARFPTDAGAQVLLAEAACRTGDTATCADAAGRALALAPGNVAALTWSGAALAKQAATLQGEPRAALLRRARGTIAKANRADTEAPGPLIAYYRSFADAGDAAPPLAVDGLTKAMDLVPNAPATRLALGREMAARGMAADARRILLPVAHGGYDSPERLAADAILTAGDGR